MELRRHQERVCGLTLTLTLSLTLTPTRLQRACRERGLLLLTASVFETLRFIPPLTVSAAEIDHALAVVADALREVAAA